MNYETAKQMVDTNIEKEETIKVVKTFLNDINDSLYLLKKHGFDTSDAYALYDLLRYEVLTASNIEIMYRNGNVEEVVKRLKVCSSLLNGLIDEIKYSESKIDDLDYDKKKSSNKIKDVRRENIKMVSHSLGATLFATALIGLIPGIAVGIEHNTKYVPQTMEYELDTTGEKSETAHYYRYYENVAYIDEYSPVDETGHRMKRTYKLYGINLDNKEDLMNIDLSSVVPISEELIYDEEINNKSTDIYKKYIKSETNEDIKGVDEEYELDPATIVIAITGTLIISAWVMTAYKWAIEDFDTVKNGYKLIIELAKNKKILKEELNNVKTSKKEKQKLEKVINTSCSRIEKLIVQTADIVATTEDKKFYAQKSDLEETEKKFKAVSQEAADKKNEVISNIENLSKTLTEEISKLDVNNEKDVQKILHSVPISASVLFEKQDDHLVIKSMFVPMLQLLDLGTISFDNVDVRCIDFSNTNAIVNVRKVYNMDLSFAIFSDGNIIDWSDYSGVNLTGTVLEENPSTMINADKAIREKYNEM